MPPSLSSSAEAKNPLLAPLSSLQRARDGAAFWWGEADTPAPPPVVAPGQPAAVTVAVSPVRPGHALTVEYRVDGGPVQQAIALPEARAPAASARLFRALLPGQPTGLVEYLPVLRFAGQPVSPRLEESAALSRYRVGAPATPAVPPRAPAAQPRWDWSTRYLGSVTATLSEEVVGPTPDGLRIDWHVTEGNFVGPGLDAVVLPGATDWLRIRKDGIGIVNVLACFQTGTGTRIFGSYGGILDLGQDGYARALRNEFDPFPPVVVTPTYLTADPQLEWLNRAQCIGVGRIDMSARLVGFDAYLVQVGERKDAK